MHQAEVVPTDGFVLALAAAIYILAMWALYRHGYKFQWRK